MKITYQIKCIVFGCLVLIGCVDNRIAEDLGESEAELIVGDGHPNIAGIYPATCTLTISTCRTQVKESCSASCNANTGDCYTECTQEGFTDCLDFQCR